MEDTLAYDLMAHLYAAYQDRPRGVALSWVMNMEWFSEIRKLHRGGTALWEPSASGQDTLFGIPILVRSNGGVPHLAPNAVRHGFRIIRGSARKWLAALCWVPEAASFNRTINKSRTPGLRAGASG